MAAKRDQTADNILLDLASSRREGRPTGICSVCSAHPWVIEAACDQALENGAPLLIEATSNQVNHRGGYTGMAPDDFRQRVASIASKKGLSPAMPILGGDHLGPNPWQSLPACEAMREAELTVRAYVRAGFQKIHLDTSMACAGDPARLSGETIARRATLLCAAAEQESCAEKPLYVIGTEVPTLGGATEDLTGLAITSREAAAETLAVHRRVFREAGLGSAWSRVIALVVQPGVEFNHLSVIDYNSSRAAHLTGLLDAEPDLVFEAHSTDYQKPEAYRDLVRDGFAILKVGPALTFAMREALLALERIEQEPIPPVGCSRLSEALERAMLRESRYWDHHYAGDQRQTRLLRLYSYSDRVRYYWNQPEVAQAVETLMANLHDVAIPETMISAHLPCQYERIRARSLRSDLHSLVLDRVRQVLRVYAEACAATPLSLAAA
jgi:D-tagatose-1,6-bisphosphate aldolase subunit GatZ/KbaZ